LASKQKLPSLESSRKLRYILIITVLVIAFSVSFIIRSEPAEFGFELNEFDPFYNYKATQFMVENGLPSYLEWRDDMSWYPHGRDVSATSQVMLHISASTLYQVFGVGSTLYDFTILFPVVIGSLTTIIIFALVRTISGTSAGLLASLFFSICLPIVFRGTIGWFKSEPLGLFYGLLAVYLLLSGIKSDKGKVSLAKIVGGGILLAFGLASWGGIQFFILPIGVFFLVLPFLRKDNKFIMWTSVVFTFTFVLVTMSFEKTGIAFPSSLSGFFIIGCTAFLVAASVIKKIGNKNQLRNGLALLGGAIITGIVVVSSSAISLPAFRYLNAANPFLIASEMLTDSVSEHQSTTTELSFLFFSVFMIFAGIGAWLIFQNRINLSFKIKNDMAAFALILGLLGVYFSSSFVRLEVFGGIAVIVLASIGTSILVSKILRKQFRPIRMATKVSFCAVIVTLLTIPTVYPEDLNWVEYMRGTTPTILNGGTHFLIATNDWAHSLEWLKENTPEDAVVVSWWDYGYWISVIGERKSVSDNATLLDWQIKKTASMFFSSSENAWKILTSDVQTDVSSHFISFPMTHTTAKNLEERHLELFENWKIRCLGEFAVLDDATITSDGKTLCDIDDEVVNEYPSLLQYWKSNKQAYTDTCDCFGDPALTGMDADYIMLQIAALQLPQDHTEPLYYFGDKGGDVTKAFWMIKIAELPLGDYYNPDGKSFNDKFWNETLFAKLIPFSPYVYVDVETGNQSLTWTKDISTPIYVENIKFPINEDGPFKLVYSSPSLKEPTRNMIIGVLIYKINYDYQSEFSDQTFGETGFGSLLPNP